MSFKDMITNTTNISYFEGAIPVNYKYTVGIAGNQFFQTIMKKGDFVASKCSECGRMNIYPTSYCEACFAEIKEYVSVGLKGELYSYTECTKDFKGVKYKEPHFIGLVRFEGVEGGIVHRLKIKPQDLKIGMAVKARLQPANKRVGSVDDILYFEKA